MVSCDFVDEAFSSQNGSQALQNTNILKTLHDYVIRFTLLAGNLLLEGSKKENFVFSPQNIFNVFSLFQRRTIGDTRNELCSIFGFPDDLETTSLEDFHQKFTELLQLLQKSKNITLNSAAGIFTQTGSQITATFSESTENICCGKISNINISQANPISCINDLISHITDGQIKSILPQPLNTDDTFFIISALNFRGQLENEFPKSSTKKELFETGFSTINADMMSQQQYVQYLDDPKFSFRILGLPYENRDFSLYIQLSRDDPKSANFCNNFDNVYLSLFEDLSSLSKRLVYYKIPRFQVTTISDLKNVLVKFGSQNIVTSPMLDDVLDGTNKDSVEVKHGVSFEFNETDAKSSGQLSVSVPSSTPPVKFFVNKPFTFFIYYHPMKMILLTGAISKPLF